MAHYIRTTNLHGKDIQSPTSRYAESAIYQYKNVISTFETYKRRPDLTTPDGSQWMEITPEYEFRPDILSNEVYGTPDFWWRIMEVNGMIDILEFRTGRNIRLPGHLM